MNQIEINMFINTGLFGPIHKIQVSYEWDYSSHGPDSNFQKQRTTYHTFDTLQNLKVHFRKENGNFDLDFCVLDLALYFNTAHCCPGKFFQF